MTWLRTCMSESNWMAQILTLCSCVTLNKLLNFSEPQFPQRQRWINNSIFRVVNGIWVKVHFKGLAEYLADQFSSVTQSCQNSLQPHGQQHARFPHPSPTPRACSNSCPLSLWCHPTISYSVVPFSSHLQSFPGSGSFQISQSFASRGQSIGASTLASVLLVNIQGWLPLGLTGLISLQFKGLSRVFSNTTVQKHQFFGA